MTDRRKQVENSLRVYLDRGRKALSCLSRGELDQANDWLERRDAAFRNYLALNYIVQSGNFPSTEQQTDVIDELLQAVETQNNRLKTQLRQSVSQTAERMQDIRRRTRSLSKFQSGNRKVNFRSGA